MTTASYEQGFRDALLVAIAAMWGETIQTALEHLTALLAEKQLDLWKTLAIVRAPGSADMQQLRARLRAPNAIAIDETGQMLFIRLNGNEYDTGVTALREEIARLRAELKPSFEPHPDA